MDLFFGLTSVSNAASVEARMKKTRERIAALT